MSPQYGLGIGLRDLSMMADNSDRRERYARHLSLPGVGQEGQESLASSGVLLVGAGGLGSSSALYLAAAGVGRLGIVDPDVVELSNLQRQILHATPDVGRPKVHSAADRIAALNPDVEVRPVQAMLTAENAGSILTDYDFVIDATDNFIAKFLVADVCHRARKPYSHAGILAFEGQTMTVLPGQTACYRCLFEEAPSESRGTPRGPLGVLPGVLGTVQATEAIKCILGIGELLTDRLLVYDALTMTFRCIPLTRRPDCSLCGDAPEDRGIPLQEESK